MSEPVKAQPSSLLVKTHHSRPEWEIQPHTVEPACRSVCYIRSLGRRTFKLVSRDQLQWLESSTLARFPWLVHAFSTRTGGISGGTARGLNLGFIEADSRKNVERNRRHFLRSLGADSFILATLKQIHSTNVFRVGCKHPSGIELAPSGSDDGQKSGSTSLASDALITNQPGILLSIRTADCLPVLIVDPRHRAIAALHAGWRGALGRIAEKVVGEMGRVYSSKPPELHAAIGPGIHACCYAVGEDLHSAFHGRFVNSEKFFKTVPPDSESAAFAAKYPNLFLSPFPPGHASPHLPAAHLDLVGVVRAQLSAAGLPPNRIYSAEFCTACRTDLFFSHRREGSRTGRMMAVIGIKAG